MQVDVKLQIFFISKVFNLSVIIGCVLIIDNYSLFIQ